MQFSVAETKKIYRFGTIFVLPSQSSGDPAEPYRFKGILKVVHHEIRDRSSGKRFPLQTKKKPLMLYINQIQGSSGCTPINVPILYIGFLWGILKILGITIHIYPLYRAYIGLYINQMILFKAQVQGQTSHTHLPSARDQSWLLQKEYDKNTRVLQCFDQVHLKQQLISQGSFLGYTHLEPRTGHTHRPTNRSLRKPQPTDHPTESPHQNRKPPLLFEAWIREQCLTKVFPT